MARVKKDITNRIKTRSMCRKKASKKSLSPEKVINEYVNGGPIKLKKKRRLFYDIETSFCQGHFWWPGYKVSIGGDQLTQYPKIICVSYKWEGEDKVYNLRWDKDQDDKTLVSKFIKVLNRSDEIVAHNGDEFDLKWIRSRALKHSLTMRPSYVAIDTYKLLKSSFRLPSNRLGEAAKYLGLDNKMDPGGIDTWRKIIFEQDEEALERMIEYCDQDVRTLEQLYQRLRNYVLPKFNYSVKNGYTKTRCPECASNRLIVKKKITTPVGTIQRYMRCKDCNRGFKFSDSVYKKYKKGL